MKISLPSNLATIQDLSSLIIELHNYSRWVDHQNIKSKFKANSNKDTFELSEPSKLLVRELGTDKTKIQDLLRRLEDLKSTSNIMTITLPTAPTELTRELLIDWCRKNIAGDILFSFQFNSNLLGGMVLRYKSRIFDWSFRRRILEKRYDFPEVIKNV